MAMTESRLPVRTVQYEVCMVYIRHMHVDQIQNNYRDSIKAHVWHLGWGVYFPKV